MQRNQKIELPQILELVKLIRDSGLDSDPRINALLNCVIADNSDIDSYNLLILSVQPYLVEQTLRANPFPAPSEEVDGKIKFGVSEENQFVGFMPEELHILIAGEPGTGKTTIANFFIAPQAISLGIKCWFFVKAGDTEKLVKLCKNTSIITVDFEEHDPVKINILQNPPNVSKAEWHSDLWDMFIQAEAIYDGTKNFLISHSYDLAKEYEKSGIEPSFFELHDFIKEKKFDRGSRDSHYQESALNRLGEY